MGAQKKTPPKSVEELQSELQALIAKGRKDGIVRAAELHALLEQMELTPEKIEETYDQFDAMGIQVVTSDPDMAVLDDDLDVGL